MSDNALSPRESSLLQSNSEGTNSSSSILGKSSISSHLTKLKSPAQLHMQQYNQQKSDQTHSSSREVYTYKEKAISTPSSGNKKKLSVSPTYSPQKPVKLVYQNETTTPETPNLFDRKQEALSHYTYGDQNEPRTTVLQSQGLQDQTENEKAGTENTKSYEDYYSEYLRWSNQNKKDTSEKKTKVKNKDVDNEYYEASKQTTQVKMSQQQKQKNTELELKKQKQDRSRVKDMILQQAGVSDALKEIQLEENKANGTTSTPPPKKEPVRKPAQITKPIGENQEDKQSLTKSFSYVKSIEESSNVDFLKYCNTSRKIKMLKEGEKLLQKMERDTKINETVGSKIIETVGSRIIEEPIFEKKEIKPKPRNAKASEREKIVKGKTKQRESEKSEDASITLEKNGMGMARDRSLTSFAELPSERVNTQHADKRSISLQEIDPSHLGFKGGQINKLQTIISQINNRDLRQTGKKLETEQVPNLSARGIPRSTGLQQIQEAPLKKPKPVSRETSIEQPERSLNRSEERIFEAKKFSGKSAKTKEKAYNLQDIETSRSKDMNKDSEEEAKEHKQDDYFVQAMPTKPPRKMSENVQSKTSSSLKTQRPRSSTLTEDLAPIQEKENPKEIISKVSQSRNNNSNNNLEPVKENATAALTEEEKLSYGDRFPPGYKKMSFLGRGGFALVWLGVQEATGVKVAMKQIILQKASRNVMNEAAVGRMLFQGHPTTQSKLQAYPGLFNIIKFIDCIETTQDLWMVFELGGPTLSKSLFEIKGEFLKGERIYGIKYLNLYKMFQESPKHLKTFIHQMAEVLQLLSDLKIVHCDIKPDNILIQDSVAANGDPFTIKMIDFGSAFSLQDVGSLGMATPEYMPPEVLKLIISNQSGRTSIEELARTTPAWAVDTWSLGAMLLEIVSGIPIWMSLRSQIEQNGKKVIRTGLLAVKGRAYDKIRIRQKAVVEGLEETARGYLKHFKGNEGLMDLLLNLLHLDPKKRISPQGILKHPYLTDE